uniref:Uncharacterized protein n=1 Tax=uncultured prokaryote TaxID=198431 RepID=A0A0H5QMC6_9ZZZZ|nr:hypothetical protein [uncultured prokaryote]
MLHTAYKESWQQDCRILIINANARPLSMGAGLSGLEISKNIYNFRILSNSELKTSILCGFQLFKMVCMYTNFRPAMYTNFRPHVHKLSPSCTQTFALGYAIYFTMPLVHFVYVKILSLPRLRFFPLTAFHS